MDEIDTLEADVRFDEPLERTAKGETIIITRQGKPIARFSPASVEEQLADNTPR
jgi:antitoxin (DNA-binding transcriptional repressor) of toxin-antitoxin stability system